MVIYIYIQRQRVVLATHIAIGQEDDGPESGGRQMLLVKQFITLITFGGVVSTIAWLRTPAPRDEEY